LRRGSVDGSFRTDVLQDLERGQALLEELERSLASWFVVFE
jgi:hypothetical protein